MERNGKELQKFEHLDSEKSFLDEIKTFFITFEGLSFGEKIKISQKVVDTTFKNNTHSDIK